MGFNEEQLKAIHASVNEDVLISAGAGSGKTNTLSERVYTLIAKGEVKPSELLILTFTNNSAHDMKRKILGRFGQDDPRYAEMLSAHIQSFDSFNAYLVRSYAGRLGVAPSFGIMSDTLSNQKRSLFVEEALEEAYLDPEKRVRLVSLMGGLGLKNDRLLKSNVLQLLDSLDRLSPEKRKGFLKEYRERFLTRDFASSLYEKTVAAYVEKIHGILRRAYVLDQIASLITGVDVVDTAQVEKRLNDPLLFSGDIRSLGISPDPDAPVDYLDKEFHDLLDLCDLPPETFVGQALRFVADHKDDYYLKEYPRSRKNGPYSCQAHRPVFVALKETKAVLEELGQIGIVDVEWAKIVEQAEPTRGFLELAEAVQDKLDAFRAEHNAYTFSDVTALALSLFTDPSYEDIAEELRERFRYVMVDEYQDTNDSQEIFLEGLLKPRKDGGRAHLFCVGDAKQSIYAFRSSNVALFRDRQRRYLSSPEGRVIAMNKNYRSAKRLLSDINHIFSSYMTLEMGGTSYLDPMERLTYDEEVNLYYQELPGYGVHRILRPDSYRFVPSKNAKLERELEAEFESKAILEDIKVKVASGFLVFDRSIKEGSKVRPCTYGDFCILLRKKRSVSLYQRLFNENGIPLNNQITVNLREINAIILLQALLSLVSYASGDGTIDLPHIFASVARSYIYQYDDTRLHKILTAGKVGSPEVVEAIKKDPIMEEVFAFYEEYKDAAFHTLFLALLERFDVIGKLYLVGDIEDNISKIESLYALILAEEAVGDGLKEFVALVSDIDKRRLNIDSAVVQESANAVDLMTIHASKGLERKIVYIPSSDNGISQGDSRSKPLFTFHETTGVSFPSCHIDFDNEGPQPTATLPKRYQDLALLDEEEQEHVRLLYVALTRAENAVYLVGRKNPQVKKSAYVMMESLPRFLRISPEVLKQVSPEARKTYEDSLTIKAGDAMSVVSRVDSEAYQTLRNEYVLDWIEQVRKEGAYAVLSELYEKYRQIFLEKAKDLDELARIYGEVFYPLKAKSLPIVDFGSLLVSYGEDDETLDEDDDEEGADDDSDEEEGAEDEESNGMSQTAVYMTEDSLRRTLDGFYHGVESADVKLAFPKMKTSKEITPRGANEIFIDALLQTFAFHYGDIPWVVYESYETDGYPDEVTFYDSSTYRKPASIVPKLPPLDIDNQELVFPEKKYGRASKSIQEDEELPSPEILERGTRLHRYMELLDFASRDLSFIPAKKERAIIAKAIACPLMQEAFHADKVYREYGYFDTELQTTGFIDLLYVKDGVYHIVDYKSSDIGDPAYETQLGIYARNVARLFGVKEDEIKKHLLSLSRGVSKDI